MSKKVKKEEKNMNEEIKEVKENEIMTDVKNDNHVVPESVPIPEIPMSLKKELFVENLVKLCNDSGLPFCIIDMIMDDFIKDLKKVVNEQLDVDKKEYMKKVQEYNKFMEYTKKDGE